MILDSKLLGYLKQNYENVNPIPTENFFSTICGCDHWTQRREQHHEPNIEGHHLDWNGNMKSKKHMQSRKELEWKEFGMIQTR